MVSSNNATGEIQVNLYNKNDVYKIRMGFSYKNLKHNLTNSSYQYIVNYILLPSAYLLCYSELK